MVNYKMEHLENIKQIDPWAVFGIVIVTLSFWSFIQGLWEKTVGKLLKKLDIETKGMREKREDRELLKATAQLAKTTAENLDKLQQRHVNDDEKIYTNLSKYRGKSQEIQEKIFNSINDLSTKIDDLKQSTNDRFSANEEKENKRVQSEIKDKIAQLYRQYNATKTISEMEFEALEDLIETYEAHGGENSFVHSVVQKEMYTWKKVERI